MPYDATWKDVKDAFKKNTVDGVRRVEIFKDDNGKSKGGFLVSVLSFRNSVMCGKIAGQSTARLESATYSRSRDQHASHNGHLIQSAVFLLYQE